MQKSSKSVEDTIVEGFVISASDTFDTCRTNSTVEKSRYDLLPSVEAGRCEPIDSIHNIQRTSGKDQELSFQGYDVARKLLDTTFLQHQERWKTNSNDIIFPEIHPIDKSISMSRNKCFKRSAWHVYIAFQIYWRAFENTTVCYCCFAVTPKFMFTAL